MPHARIVLIHLRNLLLLLRMRRIHDRFTLRRRYLHRLLAHLRNTRPLIIVLRYADGKIATQKLAPRKEFEHLARFQPHAIDFGAIGRTPIRRILDE